MVVIGESWIGPSLAVQDIAFYITSQNYAGQCFTRALNTYEKSAISTVLTKRFTENRGSLQPSGKKRQTHQACRQNKQMNCILPMQLWQEGKSQEVARRGDYLKELDCMPTKNNCNDRSYFVHHLACYDRKKNMHVGCIALKPDAAFW